MTSLPIETVLRKLADSDLRPICWWKMSNGAEFQMMIPHKFEIHESRPDDRLRFPFQLAETVQIRIPQTFNGDKQFVDMDHITQTIRSIPGVRTDVTSDPDEISLTFDKSEQAR